MNFVDNDEIRLFFSKDDSFTVTNKRLYYSLEEQEETTIDLKHITHFSFKTNFSHTSLISGIILLCVSLACFILVAANIAKELTIILGSITAVVAIIIIIVYVKSRTASIGIGINGEEKKMGLTNISQNDIYALRNAIFSAKDELN